eukprot:334071-Prymnesium_polylepis.1
MSERSFAEQVLADGVPDGVQLPGGVDNLSYGKSGLVKTKGAANPGLSRGGTLFDLMAESKDAGDDKDFKGIASDLPPEECEQLLTHVQSLSEHFNGFSEDELQLLSDQVTVMRFEVGEVVLQEGDDGTWF